MVVTRQQIKKLFIEYNGLYFNAELPLCEIRVSSHHRYYGLFQYRRNSQNKAVCKSITISDLFDYTEENLRSVLVHEMIHYYLIHKRKLFDAAGHGPEFQEMMNELNAKYDLKIKILQDWGAIKLLPTTSKLLHTILNIF